MKLLRLFGSALLVLFAACPGELRAQEWKCETGKPAFDGLAHYATLGSALLVLSEEAAETFGKKTAAILTAATAAYQVAKDNCESSQTPFCSWLFCTRQTAGGTLDGLGVLVQGPSFQNSIETEQKLMNSKISGLDIGDPKSLSQSLKPLFPNGGLPPPASVKDFRLSGNQLSSAQLNELTRSLVGAKELKRLFDDCAGSKADCVLHGR